MATEKMAHGRDALWLPYHAARLRFFLPVFTEPGEPFKAAIETLLGRLEPNLAFRVEGFTLPLSVIIPLGIVELRIDVKDGTFSIDYADPDLSGLLSRLTSLDVLGRDAAEDV